MYMRMLRSIATVVVTGAALFGGLATGASAAPATSTPNFTCGVNQVPSGNTVSSYYDNCATHAVTIDVVLVYQSIDPILTDEGDRCVPANTTVLLGTNLDGTDSEYGAVVAANSC